MWETHVSELSPIRREDDIASPRGRRLFRHWQDLCGLQALAPRAAFDPIDVPWALGYLTFVEVVPGDFFYRVDSGRAVDFFGHEMTGRLLSQYPLAERIPIIRASCETVVASGRPHVWLRDMERRRRRWRVEQTFLPFTTDGSRVTHLAVALDTTTDTFDDAPA